MTDADRDQVIMFLDQVWPEWRDEVPPDHWDALFDDMRQRGMYQRWRAARTVLDMLWTIVPRRWRP